jgi:murein DD-endopeptidase MepM/ murein hydrolase activator NlpD
MMRKTPGKLQLTPFQYYSPETNLYQFLNGKIRLKEFEFLNIALPFMGSWTISQGYDGEVTHKGDWNQALDFVIKDLDHKTYELPGIKPEDYYCFNKPVLACADGIVEECINYVDDNPIGQVNLVQNWGNTVIIKHAEHLYSKVSHLKKNSLKVKAGDFVKKGTVIALCGNSGRSPEPHLHFQIQSTPYLGSKTIAYPLAYYVNVDQDTLTSFEIPEFGQTIHSPDINAYLKRAFNFQPGYVNRVKTDKDTIETWEVFTDAYNASYFYCHENQSVAYFVNNAHVFYFTKFYGSHHAILFLFYQAAYKINFSAHAARDVYAMDTGMFNPKLWIRDLVSPFLTYTPYTYMNAVRYSASELSIVAEAGKQVFGKRKVDLNAEIKINDKGISEFELVKNGTKITVVWETELS